MNLNERVPNNLDSETEEKLYNELSTLKQDINKKFVEISAVKLIKYLQNNIHEYAVCLEVVEEPGLELGWDCSIYHTGGVPRDYEFTKKIEDEITKILNIPQDIMKDWYYTNKTVDFVNDESGRDSLINYMLGENWQQWKKEGETSEQNNKSSNKPSNKFK